MPPISGPSYTIGTHHQHTLSIESEFNDGTNPPMHPDHEHSLGIGSYGKVDPFKESNLYVEKLEFKYNDITKIGSLPYEYARLIEAYNVLYPKDVKYIYLFESGSTRRLIMRRYNMPNVYHYFKHRHYELVLKALCVAIDQVVSLYRRIGLLHLDLSIANILVDADVDKKIIKDLRIIDWGISLNDRQSIWQWPRNRFTLPTYTKNLAFGPRFPNCNFEDLRGYYTYFNNYDKTWGDNFYKEFSTQVLFIKTLYDFARFYCGVFDLTQRMLLSSVPLPQQPQQQQPPQQQQQPPQQLPQPHCSSPQLFIIS